VTRRKVQLWRFFDANDNPVPPIPAYEVHEVTGGASVTVPLSGDRLLRGALCE